MISQVAIVRFTFVGSTFRQNFLLNYIQYAPLLVEIVYSGNFLLHTGDHRSATGNTISPVLTLTLTVGESQPRPA